MTPILRVRMPGEFSAHQIRQRINFGIEFDPANIERSGRGHVIVFVADQEARTDIDRPFARRLLQHSGAGLSATAAHRQWLDGALGMMWAIIESVDMCAMRCKALLHMSVE